MKQSIVTETGILFMRNNIFSLAAADRSNIRRVSELQMWDDQFHRKRREGVTQPPTLRSTG